MSDFPRAPPRVAAPSSSSAPNAERRRKLGLSPIVTSAIAPDLMNTRLSIWHLEKPRSSRSRVADVGIYSTCIEASYD